MELDPEDWPRLALQSHDFTIIRPGGDNQVVWQAGPIDGKAMIARGDKGIGHATEHTRIGMMYLACLAVHQGLGAHHLASKGLTNGLVAETNAEDRQVGWRMRDEVQTYPGVIRRAGPGRQQNALRSHPQSLFDTEGIITIDAGLRTQLVQIMNEVVGKAVIVIDDEDHGLPLERFRGHGNRCPPKNGAGLPRAANAPPISA